MLECIQEHTASLLGTIRSYVQRFGLATGDEVPDAAREVLQEVVVEALAHADAYIITRPPLAWLLGIAVNVIKRKKVERARRSRREILLGDLARQFPDHMPESDLLDYLLSTPMGDAGQQLESDEQVQIMLAHLSHDDQHILRLAFLEDFDREMLARRLGVSAGTARMRLHRALSRLRAAWFARQQTGGEDE